jgi:outer membrane biosynthesis protein TonB
MPKVMVKPAPGPDIAGRWALGVGMRQKFDANGKPVTDGQGNPTYWPARSGVFLPAGQDTELTITDEELRDLQTGANSALFMVQVTDPAAQPDTNEGGSSMAANQPGSTVPPGTTPSPTPAPAPAPTPAPGSPAAPAPGTGTPSAPTSPTEPSPATKRAK